MPAQSISVPWNEVVKARCQSGETGEGERPDRAFGLALFVVCSVAGLVPLLRHGEPRWWILGAGAVVLAVALTAPRRLAPLRMILMRVGRRVNRVIHPVVGAILFFGVITPMAILLRTFGRDVLGLRFEPEARSYWRPRSRAGRGTLTEQF